jgi:hypothetical protein
MFLSQILFFPSVASVASVLSSELAKRVVNIFFFLAFSKNNINLSTTRSLMLTREHRGHRGRKKSSNKLCNGLKLSGKCLLGLQASLR